MWSEVAFTSDGVRHAFDVPALPDPMTLPEPLVGGGFGWWGYQFDGVENQDQGRRTDLAVITDPPDGSVNVEVSTYDGNGALISTSTS